MKQQSKPCLGSIPERKALARAIDVFTTVDINVGPSQEEVGVCGGVTRTSTCTRGSQSVMHSDKAENTTLRENCLWRARLPDPVWAVCYILSTIGAQISQILELKVKMEHLVYWVLC